MTDVILEIKSQKGSHGANRRNGFQGSSVSLMGVFLTNWFIRNLVLKEFSDTFSYNNQKHSNLSKTCLYTEEGAAE